MYILNAKEARTQTNRFKAYYKKCENTNLNCCYYTLYLIEEAVKTGSDFVEVRLRNDEIEAKDKKTFIEFFKRLGYKIDKINEMDIKISW